MPRQNEERSGMNAQQIHAAIKDLFIGGWVYIKELRAGTGFSKASDRYLDAWLMQTYPSSPMRAVAIEIKTSRSDFLREVKQPLKRDSALRISNHFYFACPAGLIKESELPDEAGLIEIAVGQNGKPFEAKITSDAPYRDCSFPLPFVASLARRVEDPKAYSWDL